MADEAKINTRGIWGSGYQKRVEEERAGIPPRVGASRDNNTKPASKVERGEVSTMNKKKLERTMRKLNPAAIKVYEATPIDVPHKASQVHHHLKALGHNFPINAITKHLKNLKDDGLVKETSDGRFTRVIAKENEPMFSNLKPANEQQKRQDQTKPGPVVEIKPEVAEAVSVLTLLEQVIEQQERQHELLTQLYMAISDEQKAQQDTKEKLTEEFKKAQQAMLEEFTKKLGG